jgi:hypothetical protein
MQAVVVDYAADPLGEIAGAFLSGYGDGSAPDAPARGVAAMQAVDLYSNFYYERGGTLRFPMDASGILYPGIGLAAYLDAHSELLDDVDGLQAGLLAIGFAAVDAQFESSDGMVLVTLHLPDVPTAEGALVTWTLVRSAGHWRGTPFSPKDRQGWPRVGGFDSLASN